MGYMFIPSYMIIYSGEKFPPCIHNSQLGGIHKLRLQDLAFFDHLPPSVYIFYGIKVYKKLIFLTTYPPPLVNVVCERPLSKHQIKWKIVSNFVAFLENVNGG